MSHRDEKWHKPVIGVTGGIGAGKSTVARLFESLGGAVIDSDRVGHEQLEDPGVIRQLREWWGDRVCRDGHRIDRSAVAAVVFEDPVELRRLEALLYPRIEAERQRVMRILDADDAVRAMVLDTPKLFEAGLDTFCDAVVFVHADESVRAKRLGESRGWEPDELRRREKLMMPLDRKRSSADYVVANQTDAEILRDQVEQVFAAVLRAFEK